VHEVTFLHRVPTSDSPFFRELSEFFGLLGVKRGGSYHHQFFPIFSHTGSAQKLKQTAAELQSRPLILID